jgi:hypothetical protein
MSRANIDGERFRIACTFKDTLPVREGSAECAAIPLVAFPPLSLERNRRGVLGSPPGFWSHPQESGGVHLFGSFCALPSCHLAIWMALIRDKSCHHASKTAPLREQSACLIEKRAMSSDTTKTTLRLPRELLKDLKRVALETDRSLQEIAVEAFEDYLKRRQKRT